MANKHLYSRHASCLMVPCAHYSIGTPRWFPLHGILLGTFPHALPSAWEPFTPLHPSSLAISTPVSSLHHLCEAFSDSSCQWMLIPSPGPTYYSPQATPTQLLTLPCSHCLPNRLCAAWGQLVRYIYFCIAPQCLARCQPLCRTQ